MSPVSTLIELTSTVLALNHCMSLLLVLLHLVLVHGLVADLAFADVAHAVYLMKIVLRNSDWLVTRR